MNNKDFRYGTKKHRYLSKTIKSKKQKLKNFIKIKETPIIDHQVSTLIIRYLPIFNWINKLSIYYKIFYQVSDLGTPVAVDDEIISTGSNYLQKYVL